ncbi:Protein of unknown function [Thermobacillus xylanilyticus]|uniref:Uncharacterized protein n=2 Tax=Thermobacillus xylanilyticus TaxID=76633 RepID=A0ABN7S7J5_THEXY|nr:Protein of unknown function [Thermobacillus xylanilyticus]
MKKARLLTTKKGFRILPSEDYTRRMEREKRIKILRDGKCSSPTNQDILSLMLDIAERQSEIFDMIKEMRNCVIREVNSGADHSSLPFIDQQDLRASWQELMNQNASTYSAVKNTYKL